MLLIVQTAFLVYLCSVKKRGDDIVDFREFIVSDKDQQVVLSLHKEFSYVMIL